MVITLYEVDFVWGKFDVVDVLLTVGACANNLVGICHRRSLMS
jgi:hypothetical protein